LCCVLGAEIVNEGLDVQRIDYAINIDLVEALTDQYGKEKHSD
jgi:hypothetical protein